MCNEHFFSQRTRSIEKSNWRFLTKILLVCGLCLPLLSNMVCMAQDGYTAKEPKIAYWIVKGQGPVVIVVHGGPGVSHDYLTPEWTALAKYATVVFYDQRGVGKSDTSECYSWRAHVLDLYRLIDQISPTGKVILAGSSWGVDLSLLFAHCYPEKVQGLILSEVTRCGPFTFWNGVNIERSK